MQYKTLETCIKMLCTSSAAAAKAGNNFQPGTNTCFHGMQCSSSVTRDRNVMNVAALALVQSPPQCRCGACYDELQ